MYILPCLVEILGYWQSSLYHRWHKKAWFSLTGCYCYWKACRYCCVGTRWRVRCQWHSCILETSRMSSFFFSPLFPLHISIFKLQFSQTESYFQHFNSTDSETSNINCTYSKHWNSYCCMKQEFAFVEIKPKSPYNIGQHLSQIFCCKNDWVGLLCSYADLVFSCHSFNSEHFSLYGNETVWKSFGHFCKRTTRIRREACSCCLWNSNPCKSNRLGLWYIYPLIFMLLWLPLVPSMRL